MKIQEEAIASSCLMLATPMYRVRIVKNELGGSATQREVRGWGVWGGGGHNGMNRGTGGLNPHPRQFEPWYGTYIDTTDTCIVRSIGLLYR